LTTHLVGGEAVHQMDNTHSCGWARTLIDDDIDG